jgi:hypothetical protein
MPITNSSCTVTLQDEVDILQTFGDLEPVLNVGGQTSRVILTAANNVAAAIAGVPFPHKWNEFNIPQFYTNSIQQDYASVSPTGNSLTNLGWLERGIVIDINNSAEPKPWRLIETGRQLTQSTGTMFNSMSSSPLFLVNWIPNNLLYYGSWGSTNTGNSTFGNNPVAGSVYTPLVTVGATSMPNNPVMQIKDSNGNFLVLTGFGTEGTTAPTAPVNATPGTLVSGLGATTVWTVVDAFGQGFRILPVPAQTGVVWQFNLVGQMKPVRFTSVGQTLAPFPDEFETHFQMGLIAQLYRFSPMAKVYNKFPIAWKQWLESLNELRSKEDREMEENQFVPDRSIMSGVQGRNKFYGPLWPFQYPLR